MGRTSGRDVSWGLVLSLVSLVASAISSGVGTPVRGLPWRNLHSQGTLGLPPSCWGWGSPRRPPPTICSFPDV